MTNRNAVAKGDRLFGDMSQCAHAYALGMVAAAGSVRNGTLEIRLRGDGEPLLSMLEARSAADIPSTYRVQKRKVHVHAPLAEVATGYLNASPGDPENIGFPVLAPDMSWAFVRGMFDATGSISPASASHLTVRLKRPSEAMVSALIGLLGSEPAKSGRRILLWEGPAALDVLGHLYGGFAAGDLLKGDVVGRPPLCRRKHLRRYFRWCQRMVYVQSDGEPPRPILVQRLHPDAVTPGKSRISDSGYDLTLLYEKSRHGAVVLYGTGIAIEPPHGWYLDVVARSSIVKRGYMVANSVGVIDRAYRGEILVPLFKIDSSAPELELPARVVQMIPRPIAHFPIECRSDLSRTHRGAGGFGSTG